MSEDMSQEMSQKDDFFGNMLGELQYAEEKHGTYPKDVIHGCAILNEEAGKLTQACIDYTYGHIPRAEAYANMEQYALRVGAMAHRFYSGMPSAPHSNDK
ncbi:hypothetical protein [Desulfovibrio cuneatus]|uniref:hypothetical protein n=1 Tax=Desulfovibrio cuneatus TaxID=159728 RepID=UPI000406B2AC|nr:hypothetical protein [Desulfovibrio cuneatus]